jgi:hypothetical protein
MILRQLGGAISETGEDQTAYGNRSARYNLSIDASWERREDDEPHISWTRSCWSDLRPYSNGGVYLNFAGLDEEGTDLTRSGIRSNYNRQIRPSEHVSDGARRSTRDAVMAGSASTSRRPSK